MPLFQLPQLITQLVNARVAITRLAQFLSAPQKPPADYLDPAETGAHPCVITLYPKPCCHHAPGAVHVSAPEAPR